MLYFMAPIALVGLEVNAVLAQKSREKRSIGLGRTAGPTDGGGERPGGGQQAPAHPPQSMGP